MPRSQTNNILLPQNSQDVIETKVIGLRINTIISEWLYSIITLSEDHLAPFRLIS